MRCPEDMLPSQEWLVSICFKGLINKELKVALFNNKHTTLNKCIKNAIEKEDNVEIYAINFSGRDTNSSERSKPMRPTPSAPANNNFPTQIVEELLRKIRVNIPQQPMVFRQPPL